MYIIKRCIRNVT